MDIQSFTHVFSGVPTDWLFIALAVILVSGLAMLRGPAYPAALALSFPLAALVFNSINTAAFASKLAQQFSTSIEQSVLFIIILIILLVCTYRIVASYDGSAGPIFGILMGVAATIVILVVWVQVPALDSLWHFGTQVQNIFGAQYRFWWFIASYLVLAFTRG